MATETAGLKRESAERIVLLFATFSRPTSGKGRGMKTGVLLISTVFFAACSGFGQESATRPAGQSAVVTIVPAQTCPVSMRARQSGATDMVRVKEGQNVDPETLTKPGQRIRLTVARPKDGRQIASATVTANGFTARDRIRRTDSSDASDTRRTLQVAFAAEDDGFAAQLVLPGFTAIQSVHLDSVTYTDGSTWKMADDQTCTVIPDFLMLVADK